MSKEDYTYSRHGSIAILIEVNRISYEIVSYTFCVLLHVIVNEPNATAIVLI